MRDVPGFLVVSHHNSSVENFLAGHLTKQGQVELWLGEVKITENWNKREHISDNCNAIDMIDIYNKVTRIIPAIDNCLDQSFIINDRMEYEGTKQPTTGLGL